jgi:CheY-like chemotaxis protein
MGQSQDNITVLLVDDDEVDIMGVRRAFRNAHLNNHIIVASNGREALDLLRDGKSVQRPYLVLLDLNMPRMGGLEFLEQTRKDPRLKSSVIFVLTTSNAQEDKQEAWQHNIAGYIVKDRRNDGSFINAAALLEKYTQNVEFP